MQLTNQWLIVSIVAGAIACLAIVALKQLSQTESLLLSIVLTLLSTLGSWLISKYYSELGFNASLKMFALKAAEKVTNLSIQLDRLASFLQEDSQTDVDGSLEKFLLERELRIEAAVHIINTLKSVNDRSLSDWQGIIGEEIEEHRQEQAAREEQLMELIHRVENLQMSQAEHQNSLSLVARNVFSSDLDDIRRELRILVSQAGGLPVKHSVAPKKNLSTVEFECPWCDCNLKTTQRTKDSRKVVTCGYCQKQSVATFKDDIFSVIKRQLVQETIPCLNCGNHLSAEIDNFVGGSSAQAACDSCSWHYKIHRSKSGVKMTPILTQLNTLDEKLLSEIKRKMPPQPWPVNATEHLAKELGLEIGLVRAAIRTLIKRGDFFAQVDGKLFKPVSDNGESRKPQ